MGIGTPVLIAGGYGIASGSSVTTTVDAPPGSLISVALYCWASTDLQATGTVTDSATGGSNTYQLATASSASAGVYGCSIYYCLNSTHDLP